MIRKACVLIGFTLWSCSAASEPVIVVPNDNQRMLSSNRSITSAVLFSAYMSDDLAYRRLAEMYVAGAIDSTEGNLWCDYRTASPDAVQEQIFLSLKKAAHETPEMLASHAVLANLKELLPCKDEQK